MRIFKINNNLSAVCEYKKTQIAFKHEATLMLNNIERNSVKICYQNRTWESYEFQSVLEELLRENIRLAFLSPDEIIAFKAMIANGGRAEMEEFNQNMKMIGMVAKIGDVLTGNQKEANDWKTRMLKAGLENRGLIMPEDWDSLNEDEKESRLNAVIANL